MFVLVVHGEGGDVPFPLIICIYIPLSEFDLNKKDLAVLIHLKTIDNIDKSLAHLYIF